MSVRHALLALLSEGPKYGLQLRQEFEARTGEVWPLERRAGVHDAAAARARRAGRVRRRRRGRPAEGVPDHGRRARRSWRAWLRTPPDLSSPPRDELVIKILIALQVPGVDVHEVVQTHRRYLVRADAGVDPAEGVRGRSRSRRSPWWSTPSCSGWTRWSGGWTRRTAASSGRRSNAPAGAASAPAEAAAKGGGAAMTALELRDVSKVYGEGPTEVHALRDVSLIGGRRASWWRSWDRADRARARS